MKRHEIEGQMGWLKLVCAIFLLSFLGRAFAEDRYSAMLADGSRIAGGEIKDWHDEKKKPTLGGRAVFDEKNPFRWLIDHSVAPPALPEAFVEFFGGDRLPGQVVGFRAEASSPYLTLTKHLIVLPQSSLQMPSQQNSSAVRVTTPWVKRVVWQPRTLDAYDPGNVFLKDGRQIAFRSLRWGERSVTLLLEDGVQEVFFDDAMEIHFPRPDVWAVYCQQMAVLSPQSALNANEHARIVQLETTDGLKATVSTDRMKPHAHGNAAKIESWHHQCQPAWSLDPIWVKFDRVWCRRFYWPHEVPLSSIIPERVRQDSPLGSSWYWQQDRNVSRQPLQSGGQNFGWGFGVHAFHEMAFPLPHMAVAFRARAGLDESVGEGGCVRWQVTLRGEAAKTLFQSPIIKGTNQVVDSGRLALEPANDPKASRELVLSVDPLLTGAPDGADPLDIRDSLNWLEPVLELDREQLRRELSRHALSQVPTLADWEFETAVAESLVISNVWDQYDRDDPRYRVLLGSKGPYASFSKSLPIGTQDRWLVLAVNRAEEQSPPMVLQVHIEGNAVAEVEIPAARDAKGPDPILIPVDSFRGRTVPVRLVQFPAPTVPAPKTPAEQFVRAVDWRGISTSVHRPGLLPLLKENAEFLDQLTEGEGAIALDTAAPYSGKTSVKLTPTDRGQGRVEGLEASVRAVPRLGEYRYISFAWKKTDGQDIALSLAHEGQLGGDAFADDRPGGRRIQKADQGKNSSRRLLQNSGRGLEFGYRYLTGRGHVELGPALRLDKKLPKDWQKVERDLFGDFGEFTLTGFSLLCPDGEAAWFDEIYLARDHRDFEHLPSRRPQSLPSQDPNIVKSETQPERFGLISPVTTGPFAISSTDSVRLIKEHQGKANVLRTHPKDQKSPAMLRAAVALAAGKKSRLEVEVHRHSEGDWNLLVFANGEKLQEKLINKDVANEKQWATLSVDLSKFAGQPVLLELRNAPNNWQNEDAYWGRVALVEQ